MENASKALIIAGAILLSILIIGLGMGVFNSADKATGSSNLDETEQRAHNSKFSPTYEGKQSGSSVKALVNAIKSNNKEYADRQVTIYYSPTTKPADDYKNHKGNITDSGSDVNKADIYNTLSNVKSKTSYYVNFHTGDNGIIDACDIHVYSNED